MKVWIVFELGVWFIEEPVFDSKEKADAYVKKLRLTHREKRNYEIVERELR